MLQVTLPSSAMSVTGKCLHLISFPPFIFDPYSLVFVNYFFSSPLDGLWVLNTYHANGLASHPACCYTLYQPCHYHHSGSSKQDDISAWTSVCLHARRWGHSKLWTQDNDWHGGLTTSRPGGYCEVSILFLHILWFPHLCWRLREMTELLVCYLVWTIGCHPRKSQVFVRRGELSHYNTHSCFLSSDYDYHHHCHHNHSLRTQTSLYI